MDMPDDRISASAVISAAPEEIFAVLADPASHAAIDGTGWVTEPKDADRLSAVGQVFRMAMYHPKHPDGAYETANRIDVFDPPHAIAWTTGYEADGGELRFGGWWWRYDLAPAGPSSTTVTLTYDWSAVPDSIRRRIDFPPFPREHLEQSLAHLGALMP